MIAALIAALLGLCVAVAVAAAEKRRRRVGGDGDDAAAWAGLSQGIGQGNAANSACICPRSCAVLVSGPSGLLAIRFCVVARWNRISGGGCSCVAFFALLGFLLFRSSWKPSIIRFRVHSPFYETACFARGTIRATHFIFLMKRACSFCLIFFFDVGGINPGRF